MRTIAFWSSVVLIFIIPWEGVIDFPGLGTAAKAMGLAVTALWGTTIVTRGRLRKPSLFHIMVCLFVLWNVVSIWWSTDPANTIARVLTWIQLLGLAFILWDLYTTRAALLAGLQAYILGVYVAIGSAVTNAFSGAAHYSHYERFAAGDSNPDGFGFIVALGIPVAWYLAGTKITTKISYFLKLVNYAYIPVAFLGLALCGTRTALIAAVPGMAFGLASLTRLRIAARVSIFLFLAVAFLFLLPQIQDLKSFQRFSTIGSEITEGDLNNRTNNWREGLASFVEHPLFGVGSDMYRSVNSLDKVAHNSFISVLVELGLIGLTLFGIILTIAFIQAWAQPKWDSRFWLTMLVVWMIGASTLTWEYRKTTWLFLSLLVVSAALTSHRKQVAALVRRDELEAQVIPSDEKEKSLRLYRQMDHSRSSTMYRF